MHSEKVGAFRAIRIEKVVGFRATVFVLISAHAPISAHPGRFRKSCA